MNANAVVFLGMVYPWGIIRHFALLGIELYKECNEMDYYFASIRREPDKGAWQLVKTAILANALIETDTFQQLVERIDSLFASYSNVLVHCGGGWGQTKSFLPLRKRYGKRLVLVGTTHSYRHDSAMRIPMSAFQSLLYLRYYDKIVFQCQYAADKFWGARLLFATGKGTIVPLGCEPFGTGSSEVPSGIASKDGFAAILQDKSLFKFVYLAGFRPGKMHSWLVQAIAPVLRQHPEARILFCGTGDKTVMASVRETIREEGLENQVVLPGQINRSDVPWLLAHCNCAVVPSRAETFGHNFLEPMFAGLPVLGTRVGIGRDIVKDGETGYGFSLHGYKDIRTKAEKLLANQSKTRRMGLAAKKFVERDFTHRSVAKQLARMYRDLLHIGNAITINDMKDGNIVKSQHYVQREYLKAWCSPRGTIATSIVSGKSFATGLEGVAAENYYYSFEPLSVKEFEYLLAFITSKQGMDMPIEKVKGMIQGTVGIALLNNIIKGDASSDGLLEVARIGMQKGAFESWFFEMIQNALLANANKVPIDDKSKEIIHRLCRNGCETLMTEVENSAIGYIKSVRNGNTAQLKSGEIKHRLFTYMVYQTVRGPKFFVAFQGDKGYLDEGSRIRVARYLRYFMAHSLVTRFYDWQNNADFYVVKNPVKTTRLEFITGDSPVVNIATDTHKELDFYWPISPDMALLLTDEAKYNHYYRKRYSKPDVMAIDILNRHICKNCVRNVHATSESVLKNNKYYPGAI